MPPDIQYHANEQERRLAEDREENFRGTARVNIRGLIFKPEYSRDVDRKNVERLKRIFKRQGCLRLSPSNHVPAIISERDLEVALQCSGKTLENLLDSAQDTPVKLELPPGYMLECLHGQHRILAARQILEPAKEEWWTVDLYLSAMKPEAKAALSEEYSNSVEFTDGEIYGKIRDYQWRNKAFAERRWRSYLSKSKQKGLSQLLGRDRYKEAFDTLLGVRGLWTGPGFSLGTMQEILAMRFDEEILNYLDHIWKVWSFILARDTGLMRETDRFTVEALQLRAPHTSRDDLSDLRTLFEKGKLFPEIRGEEMRQPIWERISQIACIIPSLYTLFKDLKLLSPCVKIVKVLIEQPFKGSLHDVMAQHFVGVNQTPGWVVFQDTETIFSTYEGSTLDQFEFGYRQLYLFALRHFPQMIGECPKKEKDRPTPTIEEPDPVTWHRFALLANRLGFNSKAIEQLKANDPYSIEARNFLLKRNPPELYIFDRQLFEDCVEQMAKARAAVVEKDRQYTWPSVVVDRVGEPLSRRCGRFFQTAYEDERKYLFLEVLYNAPDATGRGITSFFVRKSTYFAFFGRRIPGATAEAPGGRPTPNPDGDINRNSDGESSHSINLGPASPQAPAVQSPARKRTSDRSTPASGQHQVAVVPRHLTPQASENVVTYPSDGNNNFSGRRILFRVYQRGGLQDQERSMSYDDPSEVKRVALKYVRKGMHLMTVRGRGLTPERCFDAVVRDGTYTVVLVPREEKEINKLLIASGVGSVARNEPRRIIQPHRRMITER